MGSRRKLRQEFSWAVCKCFYEQNIFLGPPLNSHVKFVTREQFRRDYGQLIADLSFSEPGLFDRMCMAAEAEVSRRRIIGPRTQQNRRNIRMSYQPIHPDIFGDKSPFKKDNPNCNNYIFWDDYDLPHLPPITDFPGKFLVATDISSRLLNERGNSLKLLNKESKIFSFPLLTADAQRKLREELAHFKASGIRHQQPNSMNRNGVLMSELSLDSFILGIVQSVRDFVLCQMPELVGDSGLDSFKAFSVEYSAEPNSSGKLNDIELAKHYDNAEITLNIPLTDEKDYSGGELYFELGPERYLRVAMTPGRAIIHPGGLLHGVLPIEEGTRINLIIWMRSSSVRNAKCPMCKKKPNLERVEWASGDGFLLQPQQSESENEQDIGA